MKVTVDFSKYTGNVKPMNAVNNGPAVRYPIAEGSKQVEQFKEMNIPFVRNHDAAFYAYYGGSHTVDIHNIFPDFDADPYDPASYDFTLTDEYNKVIMMSGAEVFYRLGSKIEHESKKYGTLVPKDFKKWAVICEHIIMHMNEGWADGYHFGIRYWEIWNEPDLDTDDAADKRTWGGTKAEFFDFYTVVAKHLKSKFPSLMIGGPALVGITLHEEWARDFFAHLKANDVPLDFFSWHRYTRDVEKFRDDAILARRVLNEYGFSETESHCNEWNYMRSGADGAEYAFKHAIPTVKGAAFVSAIMSIGQREAVDMLMYYDARPCPYCGLFAPYTWEPLPSFYVFKAWGELMKLSNACEATCDVPNVYAAAASNGEHSDIMLTYYSDDDNALRQTFTVDIGSDEPVTLSRLDSNSSLEPCEIVYPCDGKLTVTMAANTVITLKK